LTRLWLCACLTVAMCGCQCGPSGILRVDQDDLIHAGTLKLTEIIVGIRCQDIVK
jgi:hypothetical protein